MGGIRIRCEAFNRLHITARRQWCLSSDSYVGDQKKRNGSHSAKAWYTFLYVVVAITRKGATQEVLLVEPTVKSPGRSAFGVSTPGSERALANRYMLKQCWLATGYFRGRMTSPNRPKYVFEVIRLVCEKVFDSGPEGQRCRRGSDDWFRDVEVYTFKNYR